jgi:phage shock protein PspC (stress-responsive transcriptional regulator)
MSEHNTPFDQIRENLNGRDGQPIVFGVCVTLAKRLHVETWITRAVTILAALFFTFATAALYVLLGFLLSETNERTSGFFRGLKIWLQERWDSLMERTNANRNGEGDARHS